MNELAWTSIKAKDYKGGLPRSRSHAAAKPGQSQRRNCACSWATCTYAWRTSRCQRSLLAGPRPVRADSPAAQGDAEKAQADPKYFENLLGKGLEKFDIAVLVPARAVKWVKAEPEVARVLALTEDVSDLQRGLQESRETLNRLELAVTGQLQVGIFPDLAQARTSSSEVLNQLVSMRELFVGKMRSLIWDKLTLRKRRASIRWARNGRRSRPSSRICRFRPTSSRIGKSRPATTCNSWMRVLQSSTSRFRGWMPSWWPSSSTSSGPAPIKDQARGPEPAGGQPAAGHR